MVIISAIVCVYYNVIIAWTLYYFVMSFSLELPWSKCNNPWNTDACSLRHRLNSSLNGTLATTAMTTSLAAVKVRSPSEEFWE